MPSQFRRVRVHEVPQALGRHRVHRAAVLRGLAGHARLPGETRKGVLTETVRGGGKRQAFLWCRLEWDGDGYRVHVTRRQGSGQNRSLQGANALLAVPCDVDRLEAGELVRVQLLRNPL